MWVETRTVDFSRMTNIFGRNGSGKTSIKEAIIYVMTGAIYGTPQIDGAIHNGKDYLSVVLDFEHDGKDYILERRRPLDSKSFSVVKMNWAEVKQDNIEELFWSWEEIVSGICVGEFMALEEIDDKFDLINNLVKWDAAKIYLEMVGADIAKKYPFGVMSEAEAISRVKNINKEIESVTSKRQQISARINELGNPAKPEMTIEQSVIAQTQLQMAEHEKTRPTMGQTTMSTQALTDIDMEIRTAEFEMTKLIKPDASELHQLKAKYDMMQAQLNAIQHAATCQTCLRPFDPKDIEAQVTKQKADMDTIMARGTELRNDYNALNSAYEIGIANCKSQIEWLKAKRITTQNQITMANSGSVDDFNTRMRAWESVKADLITRLAQDEQKFRDQQSQLQAYNNAVDRIEALKQEDKDLVKSLEGHDLAALEKVKEALSPKGVTFKEMEIKISEILKFFPTGFSIELLKKNKSNDEYKKVFNVSLGGVPYKWLSKGMKKIVDTHFANLISEKKGYNVLIVDDIESLTSAVAPTDTIKQVITLCAKDVDFEVKNQ